MTVQMTQPEQPRKPGVIDQFAGIGKFKKMLGEDVTTGEREELATLAEGLAAEVWTKFNIAKSDRQYLEQEWMKDLRQYNGHYEPSVVSGFKPNQCQAFIRLTRAKVRAMDARMSDMLFPASSTDKFWSIRATPVPELDDQTKQNVLQRMIEIQQQMAAQEGVEPQEITEEQLEETLRQAADDRVEAMKVLMEDQIKECRYVDENEQVIHEGNLYGTGILKGPMVEMKTKQRWVKEPRTGKHVMTEVEEARPFYEHVSIWDVYPDMDPKHIDDCEFIIQRRLMPKHKVRGLARQPGFDKGKINDYLRAIPIGDAHLEPFEQEIKGMSNNSNTTALTKQYEVLEYWGVISGEDLAEHLAASPEEAKQMADQDFEVECWVLGPTVIKVQINPTAQKSRPFKFFQFESVEGCVFGTGIASIMRDTQGLFNSAIRMAVDNAARAAGPVFEIDLELTGRNITEIIPWMVIPKRNAGGDPTARAVTVHKIPSMINDLMALANLFKELGDETTTLPSFMAGESASVQGAADTASGLSMLMGAAQITVKDVIASFDQGITKPAIRDLYHYNMQFSDDEDIKGDMEIIPEGSRSLVAKEIRSQQLQQTLQLSANPEDAKYINRHKLWRHLQQDTDLPEDVVWNEQEYDYIEELKQSVAQMQETLVQIGVDPQTGQPGPQLQAALDMMGQAA